MVDGAYLATSFPTTYYQLELQVVIQGHICSMYYYEPRIIHVLFPTLIIIEVHIFCLSVGMVMVEMRGNNRLLDACCGLMSFKKESHISCEKGI